MVTVDRGIAHSAVVSAFRLAPVSISYRERLTTTTYTLTPDNGQLRVAIRVHYGFGFHDTISTETLTLQGFAHP